jgi:Uma2 family endonuclease
MIFPGSHRYFTPEDYLELERLSPIKHEYVQGQILAMAGASKAHGLIANNLSALLVSYLRGSGCLCFTSDMKMRIPELNLFYYPDLMVTCHESDRNSNQDFVLFPKLIIEVLSSSTESFDRGEKFSNYKSIATLEEYILIHQDQVLVEQFERRSAQLWLPTIYHSNMPVCFKSIDLTCPIEDLYLGLELLT